MVKGNSLEPKAPKFFTGASDLIDRTTTRQNFSLLLFFRLLTVFKEEVGNQQSSSTR
jgi:hypothetical protein